MYAYIILRCGTLMPFMSIYAKNEPARILYNKRSLCCLLTSIIAKRLIGGRPLFGTPKGRKPLAYGLLPFVTIAQMYIELYICYNSDAVWNADKTNAPLKVRRELGCGGSPLCMCYNINTDLLSNKTAIFSTVI